MNWDKTICASRTEVVWQSCVAKGSHSPALLLLLCFFACACSTQPVPQSRHAGNGETPEQVGGQLHTIAAEGVLPWLRWANFSDCRQNVQAMYEAINYAPAWVREGQATPQALAVISALVNSQTKGLNPEDYDASHWPSRLIALKAAPGSADTVAQFDAALTINAMRYLSNLRIGRVNPKPVEFGIDLDQIHYDLPHYLAQQILTASNLPDTLNRVEPQHLGYKRTETALQTYLTLAAQDQGVQLPDPRQTVTAGEAYSGVEQLDKRLRLLGDLPQTAVVAAGPAIYEGPLVEAASTFRPGMG